MKLKHTIWLSLGTNLGDREANLFEGIRSLMRHDMEFVDVSGIYETEPVDMINQPKFLNLVLKVTTSIEPHQLLDVCQQAEKALKRQRILRWGPRTLDVDILLIDDLRISLPDLEVPHPRMGERAFVLGPLAEMDLAVMQHWGFNEMIQGIDLKIPANEVKRRIKNLKGMGKCQT